MSSLPPPPPMPPSVPPSGPSPAPNAAPEHCYRHPDREAGRRCTRCGRVACSECLVQASIGSQCRDCLKQSRPAATVRARDWNAAQGALVTKVLVAINVAVFLLVGIQDPNAFSGRLTRDGLLFDLGLNRVFIADGEWWRLITAGFIHFGLIHLAFNMFALWNLGQMLEPITGRIEYVLLYFAALLAGSAGALVVGGNGITGGASGAVFGLFGAAALALRARGINPFRTSIGTVLLINLVLTFSISGISIGGHIGGLIGGAACGAVVFAPEWRRPSRLVLYATPVAVAVLSVILSIAVSG